MGTAPTANISHLIRQSVRKIRKALYAAFEQAAVGCPYEVTYMKRLSPAIESVFKTITVPGLSFSARHKIIHQKPKVAFAGGACELADLLVVVKYQFPSGVADARSILYQIKMSEKGRPTKYKIDQTQLRLMSTWPTFSFGLKQNNSSAQYNITPSTLEFASYMLEPRGAAQSDIRTGRPNCYGVCPYASQVAAAGTQIVSFGSLPYKRGDVQNFFSHLAFEIGEPHTTPSVKAFIEALFRLVGLDPDPPNEFDGFVTETTEDGFAVIEISVKADHDRGQRRPQPILHPIRQTHTVPLSPVVRKRPSVDVPVDEDEDDWQTGAQGTPVLA